MYLTLYLRCIQTWAGNIVSQCIHRHYALYLASRAYSAHEVVVPDKPRRHERREKKRRRGEALPERCGPRRPFQPPCIRQGTLLWRLVNALPWQW